MVMIYCMEMNEATKPCARATRRYRPTRAARAARAGSKPAGRLPPYPPGHPPPIADRHICPSPITAAAPSPSSIAVAVVAHAPWGQYDCQCDSDLIVLHAHIKNTQMPQLSIA